MPGIDIDKLPEVPRHARAVRDALVFLENMGSGAEGQEVLDLKAALELADARFVTLLELLCDGVEHGLKATYPEPAIRDLVARSATDRARDSALGSGPEKERSGPREGEELARQTDDDQIDVKFVWRFLPQERSVRW